MPKRSRMLSKDATQLFMAIEVASQFRLHYLGLSSGKSWTTLAEKQIQPLTIISSCGKSWPVVGLATLYQDFQVI